MANLVWTGILYGCTLGIVLICYRAFMHDRRLDQEYGTKAIIDKVYLKSPAKAVGLDAREKAAKNLVPGTKATLPPWAAKTKRA
jgi:hypothetical protein